MLRTLKVLPLALPLALFVGCDGSTSNDNVSATTDALESCFSTSSGATKCALQSGAFSRDPQDVDHDGRPDAFVCAHIVKVPHDWNGGGGASGAAAPSSDATGARPPLPPVPADADCDRMGCQDLRQHQGGPGAGAGGWSGKADPASGPSGPPTADTAAAPAPAAGGDMTCPGHGPQGQGPMGAPGGDGAGGAGAPMGHGPGDPGAGHGAGGSGAP